VSLIEDHALIGDCRSAALIDRGGTLDWLCWPRFDSPACFAALLGDDGNGRWRIAPAEPARRIGRRYHDGTLVLETVFETDTGSVALTDFMAIDQPAVVRIVSGRSGAVAMRLDLTLRFQYGAIRPWVTRLPEGRGIRAVAGPDQVILHADVALRGEGMATAADFTIHAGQDIHFVLTHGESHAAAPSPPDPRSALRQALTHWRAWSEGRLRTQRWNAPIQRSLLTLKALSHRVTGGMVAAPTTSLPEWIGGSRNWDYRYCWLRDSAFSLRALMRAGHQAEARAWALWLRRTIAGSPDQMGVLYGLGGERQTVEWEVPWLTGYAGSRPVRVGNAASGQRQLDVFGEVMDALCASIAAGLLDPTDTWPLIRGVIAHLEQVWTLPDEGIWEVRGPRRHFTFSKAMAWVAFDRAIRLAETRDLPAPLDHWRSIRADIHSLVRTRGVHPASGCLTQSFGDPALDASLLLLPAFGVLPADDPAMRRTIEAIGRDLSADGLILRYRTEGGADGLPPGEGVFLACSFWYVEALAALGRRAESEALFERLLSIANDVGLLAEEYDPAERRHLGNFPQAFSHLALVDAGLSLNGV